MDGYMVTAKKRNPQQRPRKAPGVESLDGGVEEEVVEVEQSEDLGALGGGAAPQRIATHRNVRTRRHT